MYRYEIVESEILGPGLIRIDDDGIVFGIPFDESNPDYQEYLNYINSVES